VKVIQVYANPTAKHFLFVGPTIMGTRLPTKGYLSNELKRWCNEMEMWADDFRQLPHPRMTTPSNIRMERVAEITIETTYRPAPERNEASMRTIVQGRLVRVDEPAIIMSTLSCGFIHATATLHEVVHEVTQRVRPFKTTKELPL